MSGSALAGTGVTGSALMPIGNGEWLVVLLLIIMALRRACDIKTYEVLKTS